MSWIVQNLLKNRTAIKSEADIESDEFNDLIAIEKMMDSLIKNNLLSRREIDIINYFSNGQVIPRLRGEKRKESVFGLEHETIHNIFKTACNKISFNLGGYFTDDGYIDYIRRKYKLNDEDTQKMINYMKGKYKYKLPRKGKNESR